MHPAWTWLTEHFDGSDVLTGLVVFIFSGVLVVLRKGVKAVFVSIGLHIKRLAMSVADVRPMRLSKVRELQAQAREEGRSAALAAMSKNTALNEMALKEQRRKREAALLTRQRALGVPHAKAIFDRVDVYIKEFYWAESKKRYSASSLGTLSGRIEGDLELIPDKNVRSDLEHGLKMYDGAHAVNRFGEIDMSVAAIQIGALKNMRRVAAAYVSEEPHDEMLSRELSGGADATREALEAIYGDG